MEQLLEIKSVPMSFELKVQNAKLEMASQDPQQFVTRDKGSFTIQHEYPKLHIDTYETRSSMGLKSVFRASEESAQSGMEAAMSATARIAREGNMLMDIQNGMNIPTIEENNYFQRVQNSIETVMAAIPSVPANISWEPQQLSMQYEADKLRFQWRTQNKVQMEFTPASVDFLVKEYPHLEIEYVGKPLYVPPSASPDYEPPALDVTA